jgi:hypothetical protein
MKEIKGTTGMRQRLNVVLADTYLDRTDMDDAERYVSNKDCRSGNWGNWRSTTIDEVPDHEAVENLLRPHSVENAVSPDLTLEGNGPDSSKEKGKQKMV